MVAADLTTRDITAQAVTAAHEISRDAVIWTPILGAASISKTLGGKIVLKAENLQRTGSFKLRGALHKLRSVGPDCRGVVAGSAGNHAQALAYAARASGVACSVFMPVGAAVSKVAAVRAFGAQVVLEGASVDECVALAQEASERDGTTFVHPFDDADIVIGQGGVGIEIVRDVAGLRQIVVPIGGGGLATGIALAAKAHDPSIRVIGVQSEACSPFVAALRHGEATDARPSETIADGIAIKRPGRMTLPLLRRYLDDLVTVAEDQIAEAMMLLMERGKLVVEGAGAAGLGAMLSGAIAPDEHGPTAVVLSGGNVDPSVFAAIARRNETRAGRRTRLLTRVDDRPGGLVGLLSTVAQAGANVIDVAHVRDGIELGVRETAIEFAVETNGRPDTEQLLSALASAGYAVTEIGSSGGRPSS